MSTWVVTEVDEKTGRILKGYSTWKGGTGNVVLKDPRDWSLNMDKSKEEEFREWLSKYLRECK